MLYTITIMVLLLTVIILNIANLHYIKRNNQLREQLEKTLEELFEIQEEKIAKLDFKIKKADYKIKSMEG